MQSSTTMTEMYDAAISASRDDSAFVGGAADVLIREGLRVFSWSKDAGELWGKVLPDAIEQLFANRVGCVILFLSPAYLSSTWCQRELEIIARLRQAGGDSPVLLPVRLGRAEFPDVLRDVVWLDAGGLNPEEVGRRLAEQIRTSESVAMRLESGLDDDSLARKALSERDPAAFSRLAERLLPTGYAMARKLGLTASDAEDAVQSALMYLFRHSNSFDASRASIRAYFHAVLRNSLISTMRRRRSSIQAEAELSSAVSQDTGPDERLLSTERLAWLEKALQSLPPSEREILELWASRGLTTSEIAARFNMTPSSLRSRLHRAISRLRDQLSERGL